MKAVIRFLFYLYFLSLLLVGCDSGKQENSQEAKNTSATMPVLNLTNDKVLSFIRAYISKNKDDPSRVYTLLVQRDDFWTVSFQLCSIITYSELNHLPPSGYIWVDDDIVLIYTGLEYFCEQDDQFMDSLRVVIDHRLAHDLLADGTRDSTYMPLCFDPAVWNMTMKKDSVTIERLGGFNKLGPPIVEVIDFIYPKK